MPSNFWIYRSVAKGKSKVSGLGISIAPPKEILVLEPLIFTALGLLFCCDPCS
jgi:hypothetical protein